MRDRRCANPIDPLVLADYWAGTLPETEQQTVEEHLLGCDACGDASREISGLVDAIRSMARDGTLNVVISQAFLDHAAAQGLRIRQYAPVAGGSVNCTVTVNDDLLIARLAADMKSARRIDLLYTDDRGTTHVADIPFRPHSSEVILNVGIQAIRDANQHVAKLKLVSVDETGDHLLGEYTFNHTPSPK